MVSENWKKIVEFFKTNVKAQKVHKIYSSTEGWGYLTFHGGRSERIKISDAQDTINSVQRLITNNYIER